MCLGYSRNTESSMMWIHVLGFFGFFFISTQFSDLAWTRRSIVRKNMLEWGKSKEWNNERRITAHLQKPPTLWEGEQLHFVCQHFCHYVIKFPTYRCSRQRAVGYDLRSSQCLQLTGWCGYHGDGLIQVCSLCMWENTVSLRGHHERNQQTRELIT